MKCITVLEIITFLLFVSCGHIQGPFPVEELSGVPSAEPGYICHQVSHRGETLSVLARWYTGKSDNWPKLAEISPGISKKKLSVGQIVLIPETLAVQTAPVPASFFHQEGTKITKAKRTKARNQRQHFALAEDHVRREKQVRGIAPGVYGFDQLPPPPGETRESLHKLFKAHEKQDQEERERSRLMAELIESLGE